MVWYFAYGRNMNREVMLARNTSFSSERPAVLEGYKLVFNKIRDQSEKSGFSNIVKDANSRVEGVAFEVTEDCLKNLDRPEGFFGKNNPSNYYDKEPVTVEDRQGNRLTATAFIANPAKIAPCLKPMKEYLEDLIKGAKQHSLSKEYVKMLEEVETVD